VLRTWFRRWLGLEHKPEPLGDARPGLEVRVAELEEFVDYLHGALRKLRGRVTGGMRADPDPAGGDGEPVTVGPSFSKQWELAQLERTRLQEYGRAIKGG